MKITPLGPKAGEFFACNAEISVIVGPVGSGKSTAACLRLNRHAYAQKPGPDGIARTRFVIVRNTYPELRDTTMKTWFQLFPENVYGNYEVSDRQHVWEFKPKGHEYPVRAEFLFRALDNEKDVADLLSLEVTGFYFNETREINETILQHAIMRAGRYPTVQDGGCTWKGWFGDSNPWHDKHYLYRFLVDERTRDKSAMLFRQPSGLAPDAENLENLPGGRAYYTGHKFNADDARVYIEAEWGRTRAGKPIYTEYRDLVHCARFELDPRRPLEIGLDFGRTPAAAIGQRNAWDAWRIRWELCTEDMGLVAFAAALSRFINEYAPDFTVGKITGDPAGMTKDSRDHTAFDLLKAAELDAKPARTNELSIRIEAVQSCFRRLSGGEPGILIHPDCATLRTACLDGYHYRKMAITGEVYSEDPQKNEFSHIAEALQYLLLGGGEGGVVLGRRRRGQQLIRPAYAIT